MTKTREIYLLSSNIFFAYITNLKCRDQKALLFQHYQVQALLNSPFVYFVFKTLYVLKKNIKKFHFITDRNCKAQKVTRFKYYQVQDLLDFSPFVYFVFQN